MGCKVVRSMGWTDGEIDRWSDGAGHHNTPKWSGGNNVSRNYGRPENMPSFGNLQMFFSVFCLKKICILTKFSVSLNLFHNIHYENFHLLWWKPWAYSTPGDSIVKNPTGSSQYYECKLLAQWNGWWWDVVVIKMVFEGLMHEMLQILSDLLFKTGKPCSNSSPLSDRAEVNDCILRPNLYCHILHIKFVQNTEIPYWLAALHVLIFSQHCKCLWLSPIRCKDIRQCSYDQVHGIYILYIHIGLPLKGFFYVCLNKIWCS